MAMITAAQWVPRGVAAQFPTKYDFDQDEFDRIAEIANLQLEDANEDLEEAQGAEDEAANGSEATEKKKKKKEEAAQDEYVEGSIRELCSWSGFEANLSVKYRVRRRPQGIQPRHL